MRQLELELDNYLVTLARTVQDLGIPLREDGWPAVSTKGSGGAFHIGRFIYHAARMHRVKVDREESRGVTVATEAPP